MNKVFRLRPVLFILFLSIATRLWAQYPDRYIHYRAIPGNNEKWQTALDFYGSEKLDSALLYVKLAEEEKLKSEEWESFLFFRNFRGQLLGEVREPQKALDELKEARAIVRGHIDTLASVEFAENLFLSARVFTLVNDYKACEGFFHRTVELLNSSGRFPGMKAQVAYMLSRLYDKMLKAEEGKKSVDIALDAVSKLDDEYARAIYYYIQGERLDRTQLYLKADFYEAAVEAFERGGYISDYLYYYTLMKLTQQYSSFQSDFEKAERFSVKAEEYVRKNHLSNAKRYGLYFAIGDMYRSFEKYEESLEYLSRADSLIRSVFDPASFEVLLSNLYKGRLYRYMGRYNEAAGCFYTAWDIGRNNWEGRFPHEFTMYGELGRLYANQGRPDSTLYFAQQRLLYGSRNDSSGIHSIPSLSNKANTVRYYNSLVMKIEAYRQLYRESGDMTLPGHALKHCEQAFLLLNELNEEALEENSGIKNSIRARAVASYAVYFNLEQFNHTKNDVFLIQAVQSINNAQANYLTFLKRDRISDEMLPAEKELREQISSVETNLLVSESGNNLMLEDSLMKLKSQLVEVVLGSKGLENQKENNGELVAGVDVDSLKANIPQNTALLFFHVTDFQDGNEYFYESESKDSRQLVSLILSRENIDVSVVPFDDHFNANMRNYLRGLRTGDASRQKAGGSALADCLLMPFQDVLADKAHLVILADSELGDLPFESLPYGQEGAYLCNYFSTSYHYSLGLWAQSSNSEARWNEHYKVAALAPDFSGDNGLVADEYTVLSSDSLTVYAADIMRDGNHLKPLPQARQEVKEIEALFRKNGAGAVEVEYQHATKQLFLDVARQSDILHVASHGIADEEDYRNSGLFFSRQEGRAHFLTLNEIYGLETHAKLVVLSACKTNAGRKAKGEGVMALPRGFVLAGVPNVIASLWKVHDQKTKVFMVEFYRNLLSGKSYADALRLARLSAISKGWMPVDWAGFVLIGI